MIGVLRSRVLAVAPLAFLTLAAAGPTPAAAHDPPSDLADIVAPLLPSVVRLIVWAPRAAEKPPGSNGEKPARAQFFGTGFVIDPSGVIVTNKHVINNALSIAVHFNDGSVVPGTVLAAAAETDLALVKVNVSRQLPATKFANSDMLRVGDAVLAIGNPLGVGLSVSAGVVSALNRNISDGPYGNFVQTDAAINRGNSGGPLVNLEGRVVGVNTSLYTLPGSGSIGLGFAIPSDDAKFIVDRLLKYGEVRAGWAGARLQDVGPDIAAALSLQQQTGAIAASIEPNGPAAKAGLREGDIVLKFGDTMPTDSQALLRAIGITPVGQTVPITVWRRGQTVVLNLTVAPVPKPDTAPASRSDARPTASPLLFGLHLVRISSDQHGNKALAAEQSSLEVSAVDVDSPAGEAGIKQGDLVLRAMDEAVSTPEQVGQILAAARARLPFVVLLVRSGPNQRWVSLPTRQ